MASPVWAREVRALSARLAQVEESAVAGEAARARLEKELAATRAEVAQLTATLAARDEESRVRARCEGENPFATPTPTDPNLAATAALQKPPENETEDEAFARAIHMRDAAKINTPMLADVVVLLQRLAGRGHVDSMLALAELYFAGKIAKAGALRQHKRAALLWWEKVLLIDPNNARALCRKGEALFQFSDSASPDLLHTAYDLFDKAASLGSAEGSFLKGRWLVVMAPSHRDAQRAAHGKKLVEEAADAGLAKAHVFLGHCYEFPHNYKPANFDAPQEVFEREMHILRLYQRAADLNDPDGLNDIGSCYATGYGDLEKDFEKAVEYYVRAIDAGSLDAFDNLGTHYETGMNGARKDLIDLEKALHYYRQGAARRCPKCALNLGIAYEEGMIDSSNKVVLERNADMAEKLFRHSIALADDMNDKGTKTRAHKDLAALYITRLKLCKRGSRPAAENVKKLRAMMIDSVYQATLEDVNSALLSALRGRPRLLEQMLGEHNASAVIAHAQKLLAQAKVGSGVAEHQSNGVDVSMVDGPGAIISVDGIEQNGAANVGDALAELAEMLGSIPEDLTGHRGQVGRTRSGGKRSSVTGNAANGDARGGGRKTPKRGRTR